MGAGVPIPDDDLAFVVDGRAAAATSGMSLLGALVRNGHVVVRRHAVSGAPRGGYCGMGACFECEVTVDGQPHVRSCLVPVADGMQVRLPGVQVAPDEGDRRE